MGFPTTHWSILMQATIHGDRAQQDAWAEFYQRYRKPVVGFIRRQSGDAAQAEDLAQEFFLHLMESATLQRADPARGRFRSFLLGALVRFLARRRGRERAEKRGGGRPPVSLDVLAADESEPSVAPAVTQAFDREWAHLLMERVRAELRAAAKDDGDAWATLARFLPGGAQPPSYEAAAERLGWPLARLKTEVHRLRRQFRERVRHEIALTVDAPQDIETELAHLHAVLSDRSA